MNDPDGRYAGCEVRTMQGEDGKPIAYLSRRFLPQPGSLQIVGYADMAPGDRLDLLSARVLGVPTAWWRLADATRCIDPAELEQPPLQRLAVPLPGAGS